MKVVVTNNPMVRDKCSGVVEFHDTDYLGILKILRDKVHLGHKLLTHPLSGSVKPGETPYKTVIMWASQGDLDEKALFVIEDSILTCHKFTNKAEKRDWGDDILADFQLIDYDLVFSDIQDGRL